jgi:hypothetical protein
METLPLLVLGAYLLAGCAARAWLGWRHRWRGRGKVRRGRQEYPLLAGFLLLLTWPLAVWEELRRRK